MLRFTAALLLAIATLTTGSRALAHAIPSLTVEAIFNTDRSYELKVSVDPRLFLSDKPTSLPPAEASWYRNQTPAQLKVTERQSNEYLAMALNLVFSGQTVALPAATYVPMDGATNQPLAAESKEVHLLAEMHGTLPPAALDFAIGVGKDANTSVILINSKNGEQERRPQVLFPGETSRPFALPGGTPSAANDARPTAPPSAVVTSVEVGEESRTGPLIAMLCVGGVLVLAFLAIRVLRR